MTSRPPVKICGITNPEDALLALELGADYLGLNFFPGSPRFIELEQAREIRHAVGSGARLVGVFVHRSVEEIREIDRAVGLDVIQFHGDETALEMGPFVDRALKAFRVGESFEPSILDDYSRCWGYLFDTFDEHLYGGSGRTWNYTNLVGLTDLVRLEPEKPVFVAGGLRPETIAQVVAQLPTFGLDVCTGVESSPGKKDPVLMQRFFEEIAHAETANAT